VVHEELLSQDSYSEIGVKATSFVSTNVRYKTLFFLLIGSAVLSWLNLGSIIWARAPSPRVEAKRANRNEEGHADQRARDLLLPRAIVCIKIERRLEKEISNWLNTTGKNQLSNRLSKRLQDSQRRVLKVYSIAFSPDGNEIASGNGDATVRLWEVTTGREISCFEHNLSIVDDHAVAFCPDGKSLASAPLFSHWDLDTTAQIGPYIPHLCKVLSVAFSPDGNILASGDEDERVGLWKLVTTPSRGHRLVDGKKLHQLDGYQGVVYSLAFSPDGSSLATGIGSDPLPRLGLRKVDIGEIRLWDVATGRQLRQLVGHQKTVRSTVFSPSGQTLISVSEDKTIRLWDIATGKELYQFFNEDSEPLCLACSPDGKVLASGERSGMIRLWEMASGKERLQFDAHYDAVNSVAFSPDGKSLASGGSDSRIMIWDLTGLFRYGPNIPSPSTKDLEDWWMELAEVDAHRAYQTICLMSAAPQPTVRFLQERLSPIPPANQQYVAQLITSLNSQSFAERTKATRQLVKLGDLAEPALSKVIADKPQPEIRVRAEQILNSLYPVVSTETLRALRALEILERIGTPEALRVLKKLTEGTPHARVTREAQAALQRFNRKVQVAK
jgi:WD40 repeat protein